MVIDDYFPLKKLVPETLTNFTVTCNVRKQKKNSKRINKEKGKKIKFNTLYQEDERNQTRRMVPDG
jgi:hypothetical protein